MPVEIERKFLVANDGWKNAAAPGRRFCQGYITSEGPASVRIRRADDKAYVTIKGERDGIARAEYEYEIPIPDAEAMLEALCEPSLVQKTRHCVKHDGIDWEVDVFERPDGLVMAEIELSSADQDVIIPSWAGEEVTDDPRYRNSAIASDGIPRR